VWGVKRMRGLRRPRGPHRVAKFETSAIVLHEKRAVLPIFAQDPFFNRKTVRPRAVHFCADHADPHNVPRVKGSRTKIRRHHLFSCEPDVIKHDLIRKKSISCGRQHRNHLRYGIDDLSKLSFRFRKLLPQCFIPSPPRKPPLIEELFRFLRRANFTKSERQVESGTCCSDYASYGQCWLEF
jgi:hypothetical protein